MCGHSDKFQPVSRTLPTMVRMATTLSLNKEIVSNLTGVESFIAKKSFTANNLPHTQLSIFNRYEFGCRAQPVSTVDDGFRGDHQKFGKCKYTVNNV